MRVKAKITVKNAVCNGLGHPYTAILTVNLALTLVSGAALSVPDLFNIDTVSWPERFFFLLFVHGASSEKAFGTFSRFHAGSQLVCVRVSACLLYLSGCVCACVYVCVCADIQYLNPSSGLPLEPEGDERDRTAYGGACVFSGSAVVSIRASSRERVKVESRSTSPYETVYEYPHSSESESASQKSARTRNCDQPDRVFQVLGPKT